MRKRTPRCTIEWRSRPLIFFCGRTFCYSYTIDPRLFKTFPKFVWAVVIVQSVPMFFFLILFANTQHHPSPNLCWNSSNSEVVSVCSLLTNVSCSSDGHVFPKSTTRRRVVPFPIAQSYNWTRRTEFQPSFNRVHVFGHHTWYSTWAQSVRRFLNAFHDIVIVKERVPRHDFFSDDFWTFRLTHAFFQDTNLWPQFYKIHAL